jgi:hypothetical protein
LWLLDSLSIRNAERIILAGVGIFREIKLISTNPSTSWRDSLSVNESTVDSMPWLDNQEEKELEN